MVDDEMVREEARMMRPQYMESVGPMDPIEAEMQLREWARENVIERMLLKSAALADPEPVPAEVIEQAIQSAESKDGAALHDGKAREQIEVQYRIERLLGHVQSKVPAPKPKEIAEFYKRNREMFIAPELVHAAHIVKNVDEQNDEASARVGIEAALAELRDGVRFDEVANRHSDCAGNGGDLGWFPKGQMVDEFDAVVFKLPVGSQSEIFRSPFGFHIAKVLERRPAGLQPLKEAETQIANALAAEKRQKAVEDYLDALRAKAQIRQGKAAE